MSGRKVQLPRGTKIEGSKIINPAPRARDVSDAIRMRKSKKQRPVTKARAALNGIGKCK